MTISWTASCARLRRIILIAAVSAAGAACAQDYGDTPYVPTPQNVVDKMLEIAKVGSGDYVIDLGSGDGRLIITAAKKLGARGFGVDLDTQLVKRANALAAKAGVADRAKFYARDLFQTDISPATVVTIYLLPEVNLMLRPRLLTTLKPGTRVVSHDYDMGEWQPDQALTLDAPEKPVGRDHKSKVFYWVVPAKVSGKWRWQLARQNRMQDYELALNQNFQKIEGTLTVDGIKTAIKEAGLNGAEISFAAELKQDGTPVRLAYSGHITGDMIKGQLQITRGAAAENIPWKAARVETWAPADASLPPPQPPQPPQ